MKTRFISGLKKAIKITVITGVSIIVLLFLLPYLMPDTISRKLKELVNTSIEGKVEFSKARLSFFKHFPSLTLSLYDFSSTGSAPYKDNTLLQAGEVAFGIRLPALLRGDIRVNEFFISDATINVLVDENGNANYNVYKNSGQKIDTVSSPDTSTSLKIEKIIIKRSHLIYDDHSAGLKINARGFNYTGNGDLTKAIFDLYSEVNIDSFDLSVDDEPYIKNKKIRGELVTRINTNSLAFEFRQNRMRINRLPLELSGTYEFLDRGQKMNFQLHSVNASLDDVFSVIPPSYQGWLQDTKIRGRAAINATLAGIYIGGTDSFPDLNFNMKVRGGFLSHSKAPVPLKNLYLDLSSKLPSLNPDSLSLNLDSAFFNVDNGFVSSVFKIKGYDAMHILTDTRMELDLDKFDRAIGVDSFDLKGMLSLQLNADGIFERGRDPNTVRQNIIITSIPSFNLTSSLKNGYFKYSSLPQPIRNMNFDLTASCPDNKYQHTTISVDNINIEALNNYVKGFMKLENADNFPVKADLDVSLLLSDIQKFYPLDSMDLDGTLQAKILSSGNYQPSKKLFPKTEASIKVQNASLRTKYYPVPIEKIQVDGIVKNKEGTLSGLDVLIKPISFEFEGQAFFVKADLQNFDNIRYDIQSQGVLDLGRIYKVFAQEGYDVKGKIETDLSLKGTQEDAIAGRYSRLNNSGTVKVKELLVYSDLYPHPFLIDQGLFRFNQDKLQFENLRTKYRSSSMTLSGNFSNFFDYISSQGPLKGNVHLQSDYLLLDELMAYNADTTSLRHDSLTTSNAGVIMVPNDLDIRFTTDIKTVDYDSLKINSVEGEVLIKDTAVILKKTGFELAGAVTTMDATYRTLSPARAWFNYHISMDSFDVKRMYNEVKLFRELAPAAAKAQGTISLDYALEGKLNGDMYPIMPSLKGGGTVSVKKVKLQGLKFFSAVSKESGKTEINDPDLSKINFKTTIKNNVVTLEKTKIKVAGFRIKLQGQSTLDGKIKFNCRVGLPPFGIIGIPMKITGTGVNPIVKMGKTDNLPLEEQEEEMKDVDTVNATQGNSSARMKPIINNQ